MQSPLVCTGCRCVLLYPRGATNVRCALCNTITSVRPPGLSHILCRNGDGSACMWKLPNIAYVYSWCKKSNQVAHVNCGRCRMTLMYPYGAPSVKRAICHHVTNVGPFPHVHRQTVVVENPMSVDDSRKMVNNVVVGVTTEKK